MQSFSPERIREVIITMIALILSIAVHEFGHALVADKLGDRTPRLQGRVTLNPLAHADVFGTLLFPLIGLISGFGILFGWGKPVQINPAAMTRRIRMKTGHLLVAIAGPTMNVLLALFVTLILTVLLATRVVDLQSPIMGGIVQVIHLNWILAFFNLIPCPPLDGGTVLAGLLPDRYDHINQFLQRYGMFILLGLLIVPQALSIFLIPANWVFRSTLSIVLHLTV